MKDLIKFVAHVDGASPFASGCLLLEIMATKVKTKSKKAPADQMAIPTSVDKAWKMAVRVRQNAYAPYSKFQVGAALIDDKGQMHPGCNVENASYGGTICAERNAMLRAVAEGASSVSDVVVVTKMNPPAVPCAMCLQVLSEFATPETRVWLGDLEGIKDSVLISELLPRHFGPKSLERGLKK